MYPKADKAAIESSAPAAIYSILIYFRKLVKLLKVENEYGKKMGNIY